MLRRFLVLGIVGLIAIFLLYMKNIVTVGKQGLLAYAAGTEDIVTPNGGAFILKDVAGNQIAATDEQKEQFEELVKIGLGGKAYPVKLDSIRIEGHGASSKQIIFSWQDNFSKGNNLIIKKLKERILQWEFGRANEERDLLFVPLGIDLRGGVEFMCTLYDDDLARVEADDQVVDILRTRLESQGLTEPQVSRLTNGDIQVIIPGGGKAEAARTRRVLETTGKLEFRELLKVYGNEREEGSSDEPGNLIIQDKRGRWRFRPGKDQRGALGQVLLPKKAPRGETPRAFYLLDVAEITGQDVKGGMRSQNDNGGPAIGIELTATGGAKNYAYTKGIKDRGPEGRGIGGSGRFAI
ncbi:MAG: hypothetical protein HRU15_03505, partial [Planctomycetes bacterium]|nr:hypothetical protein [Planctomycetota bacterium]